MIINHNISAMKTNYNLGINNTKVNKSLEKLSSGLRVNKAGDDSAGLAISEKMRGQIRGLDMATKNSQDAISLIQTAEGAMQSMEEILHRLNELAVQSANGIYTDNRDTGTDNNDRALLQTEANALIAEIDRISTETEFNTMKLLDGTCTNKLFQIGANSSQNISLDIDLLNANVFNFDTGTGGSRFNLIDHQNCASDAITRIQGAIESVSIARSKLGSIQNRLEYNLETLKTSSINISASESRIRDVDMAKEMVNFAKNNIFVQTATAMLAQGNQTPQNVLSLLR